MLVGNGFVKAAIYAGAAIVAAHLWSGPFKTFGLRILLVVLLVIALQDPGAVGTGETLNAMAASALTVLAGWLVLRFWVRGSSARLALTVWLAVSLRDAMRGLSTFPVYAGSAWLGIVLILLVVAVWLALDSRRAKA